MNSQPQYRSVDPATGRESAQYPFATLDDIESVLNRAQRGFELWRSVPVTERADRVRTLAEAFEAQVDDLARLLTEEMGKRPAEASGEVRFSARILRYYADRAETLLADQPIEVAGQDKAVVQKRPLGALLGVMPWNYPYYQVARFIGPNLILGNTIVLKHAESVPRSAKAFERLVAEAGFPEGVYTNVFATYEQIASMIADTRIQGVSLTGSERAGAAVAATAGKHLKKCVLELGGSDPYIILDTDDIEAAADTAWATRMGNMGQACNSNKRLIVHEDIYDEFVSALVRRAKAMRPAGRDDTNEDGTFVAMSSQAAAERLLAQIDDAVEEGATLEVGGRQLDRPGAWISPAVLTGITSDMKAYDVELFGPVATVYSVPDDESAVALANNSSYGLGGAVFSTDVDRAKRVADRLDVGMVNVNLPAGEGPEVPFGGVKRSGFGRELGPLGVDEFANRRVYYQRLS